MLSSALDNYDKWNMTVLEAKDFKPPGLDKQSATKAEVWCVATFTYHS